MRAELAYCAGLFEGEGTVYLRGERKCRACRRERKRKVA